MSRGEPTPKRRRNIELQTLAGAAEPRYPWKGSADLSASSTLSETEQIAGVPGRLRALSYGMLAIVFAAVFLSALFSPPLLDDADSTHA